jgi:PKD repeat protein
VTISYVGQGTVISATGTTPVSMTATLPSGIAAGDVLILSAADGLDPGTITDPPGWTLVERTADTGTAPAEAGVNIWWKAATGSDTAPVINCSSTGSRWIVTCAAYRGVDNTNPFIAEAGAAETGGSSTTTHTAPALTNTVTGAWGVFALSSRQNATPYTVTAGAGLTTRVSQDLGNTNTTNTVGYWADSAGSVATGTVTYSAVGSSGSAITAMWAGLLRPATGTPLVPGFTTTPSTGTAPLTVTCTDSSSGATTRSWTFGDGGTSTATSPSHTFTAPGAYTITQTVGNGTATASTSKTVTATAPPSAKFTVIGSGTYNTAGARDITLTATPGRGSGCCW